MPTRASCDVNNDVEAEGSKPVVTNQESQIITHTQTQQNQQVDDDLKKAPSDIAQQPQAQPANPEYFLRPSAKQRNKRQILFGWCKNLSHV